MIYLKPLSGLGNRMRAIDSTISWCQKNKQDLTILWNPNEALNCSFRSLFEIPKIPSISITVLECPLGFPERYMSNRGNIKGFKVKIIRRIDFYLRYLFTKRDLNKECSRVLWEFRKLSADSILTNEDFEKNYSFDIYFGKEVLNQLDLLFYSKIQQIMEDFAQNVDELGFISSCYRIQHEEGNYKFLVPARHLSDRIKQVVRRFGNTIGVHIRRTDHVAATAYSETGFFVTKMKNILAKEPDSTFFLATDDLTVRAELKAEFGNKIIYYDKEIFDRNNPEAIEIALVEMFCLAQTKQILGSHLSTFSQVAANIGGIVMEEIINNK